MPVFDTDYVYACRQGTEWRSESRTCEPERIVTVDEDYVYTCQTGTIWTHTPASCQRRRIVVVDEDYQYGCVQTWNGSTHAGNAACTAVGQPGCTPTTGRVCTQPSGLPSSYTCQTGYQGTVSGQACGETLNVSTSSTWLYTWNTGKTTLQRPMTDPFADAGCAGGRPYKSGSFYQYDYSCPAKLPEPIRVEFGSAWLVSQSGTVTGTTWSPDGGSCTAAESSACSFSRYVCLEGPETRTVNGVAVYQDCWRRNAEYTCGSRTDYAGCSPPAGMTESGSRCIATDSAGTCTGTERTYTDPSAGCTRYEQGVRCETQVPGAGTPSEILRDVVSDTWDNGCAALRGNGACVKQGEVVIEGEQTRVINGLPVTRNPWTVREDYICSSSSNVNSCSPFTGCVQQAQSCASQDRAGNCTAYNRTYRCENPANDGGTPVETPREVVGEYWTDPCATNRNDPACRMTANEVVIGNETRVINGLSVTRDPWRRRETWTCDRSSPVNTCAPLAGCTQTGQVCGGRAPDGSCSVYDNVYRCEVETPPAGTPTGTVTDQVGGGMEPQACEARTDGACRLTNSECTQPGGTRNVNGVPTTADCWEQTDTYTCEGLGPTESSCNPPSGCELKEEVCLDDVPADQCRAWENVYECTREVVTEETNNSCQTRVCIGDMCVGTEDEGSDEMPDALAALLAARLAGEDYSENLTIFKGQPMRCRKAIFGFRNCCKDSGWGVDLGLTQCSEEEKTLMQRQEAKATHYVGTYCSQKSFFGVCIEKSMRYCAFEGTIARIVQEAGRPQVNKTWGTPKEADCSGFTIEEFQQLDLTNVDFSDFTDEMMSRFTSPDPNSTIGRIQSNIENLMGSGSPGFGETNEAGGDGE
ncbi:MAG: conjugal transfer protein TraN [Brevundimonas sp.]